jgi:hypothetical protein
VSALFALAESYGAPPEELAELRAEILDAKQRMEGPAANVWPSEVVALWAAREAAKASGRAPPRYGPKVPPRPPIPMHARCRKMVRSPSFGFPLFPSRQCGLPEDHEGDCKPPEGR